jgi:hypothetical protein
MAAQAFQNAPSRRFIKAYLFVWALLGAGALTYLTTLAWRPNIFEIAPTEPLSVDSDPGVRAMSKALAEMGTVRHAVSEIQRDVGQLKETIEQHEQQEKVVQSRISVLEERFTALPVTVTTTPAQPVKAKAVDKAAQRAAATLLAIASPHMTAVTEPATPAEQPATPVSTDVAAGPIETGSISVPAPVQATPAIVFGEPVVTQTKAAGYAVQLSAGQSLEGLKLTWSQLAEKHGALLAALQPRYAKPRNAGGPYRLLAGPLPSKTDADRLCAAMGAGHNDCFATLYVGEPL